MSGPPFTVKALFDYVSDHDDDLNFSIGQVITVTAEEDADWYCGEYSNASGVKKEGIFPRNFVERYEPAAPPRPVRPSRAKREPEVAPPEPVAEVIRNRPGLEAEAEAEPAGKIPAGLSRNAPPFPPTEATAVVGSASSKETEAPIPLPAFVNPVQKPASKPPPPAVSGKPTSSSFKDRIAAFNKPAAPPIAPFKPGGLGANTFIKKPFVAPPPSKDAYVPQPRDPTPKIYRREEDPEIVERSNREPQATEIRPIVGEAAEVGGDQPKPTSLKERIAQIQKQQLEQAARHAEAAQKKEKPKKPPKKRADPHDQSPITTEGADLERIDTAGTVQDHTHEAPGGDDASEFRPPPAVPQLASPPQPSRELVSDTNDADNSAGDTEDAEETSTSREDYDNRARQHSHTDTGAEVGTKENDNQEEAEEDGEEEEIDTELKRRMELRDRMAKMSGGMGMMGMFGPPGSMPGIYSPGARKPRPPQDPGRTTAATDDSQVSSPLLQAPPVPVMPLPGMNAKRPVELIPSPKEEEEENDEVHTDINQLHDSEEVIDVDHVALNEPSPRASTERAPPPLPPQAPPPLESKAISQQVPPAKYAPVPPPPESRPAPLPPKSPLSFSNGEDSDDELSSHVTTTFLNSIPGGHESSAPIPPPLAPQILEQQGIPAAPRKSSTYDSASFRSDKRLSRGPPPIPVILPQQSLPLAIPPPPPLPASIIRQSSSDVKPSGALPPARHPEEMEGEVTEYDGDYDTDIAPGAKYKDALKAHERDSSLDDGTITDDLSHQSPRGIPENSLPPSPNVPRAVPPPPPSQPPKSYRTSMDTPRPPVPPVSPPKERVNEDEEEYDPYRYAPAHRGIPPPPIPPPPPIGRPTTQAPAPSQPITDDYGDMYDASPVHTQQQPLQPPPGETAATITIPQTPIESSFAHRNPRASIETPRGQTSTRRSMDVPRPSVDQSFIAADVDLSQGSMWWTEQHIPPAIFQNRKDILCEIEESTSARRGGKTTVSKDVYILFMDYSQTIITARFDARNPVDVLLEQRHEAPPTRPRQDQLEDAHVQIGIRICEAANAIQNSTVADGTPHGLIQHLLTPLTNALLPIGTRAYGALVYANLANASIQQHDEIRAGDIVSLRNARFQGHRGTMHQKYAMEVGKPDHVAIVLDWDGTKKKIRAWEQGRESKKVKVESFKLADLKSGECKVWRVMPRSWVGWESPKG